MAEERARDRVWKFALAGAIRNDNPARPNEIAKMADVSERTARECLNVIANCGWLERQLAPDGTVRFVAPEKVEWTDEL